MTRWWRSHSVRVRLTLWYVAVMIVVLGVYAAAVLAFVSRSASQALDQQIRLDFPWIAATIFYTQDGVFEWNPPEELVAEGDLPWVQLWRADGSELLFRNAEAQRLAVPESQALAAQADGRIVTVPTDGAPIRILSRRGSICLNPQALVVEGMCVGPEPDATPMSALPIVIQVAMSETQMRQELNQLALILVFGLPLAVAVAGLGGYTLARRALLPIERMTERAQSITAERLDDRLPVHNPDDEMGRLATVFNATLGRLEASFERMRRFTADVSHELRTPLTSIRSVGEVGLREHRDDAAHRTIIGSMLEEADRLASLVDRLLTLSRAETGEARLTLEVIDLQELAESVAADLAVLAEEKRQTIAVEPLGSPMAYADRCTVRQALINLVDNAIKFSPAGGRIRIRVTEAEEDAVIDVIDSGAGIDPASRERIFERFYRAADVTGQTPGAGLGLSIARGAVEANGGHLVLESSGAGGSTFRIALPRAAPARRRAAG